MDKLKHEIIYLRAKVRIEYKPGHRSDAVERARWIASGVAKDIGTFYCHAETRGAVVIKNPKRTK
jgi:hypothetical protein